jgi:transmembrane sensor
MIQSASSAALDCSIRDQAISWYVRLHSGEMIDSEHDELQRWLQQDASHQHAWTQVSGFGERLRQLPAALATPALQAIQRGRRDALRRLGGAASIAVVGLLGGSLLPWRRYSADLRTHSGQRSHHVLGDGSQLWLNTASALKVGTWV